MAPKRFVVSAVWLVAMLTATALIETFRLPTVALESVHNSRQLQEEEGFHLPGGLWSPVLSTKSCEELTCEINEQECVIRDSQCYEFFAQDCVSSERKCELEWAEVLQSYDRNLFKELQSVIWSFFSMPPNQQRSLVRNVTESISRGDSAVEETFSLFDSFLGLLPLVEDDLTVNFNETAWRSIVEGFRQEPDIVREVTLESLSPANGNSGVLSRISEVFALPDGLSFMEFMSTIQWDKGLLENVGLTRESFGRIAGSFREEEELKQLATDVGLLVRNIESLRRLVAPGA
eukprot:GHVQ01004545.1.p1 GENE.GHVQ01004545.1~~GHVQ01004545.1.p1  ORF type:complete len:290 (+),score=27.69 GHVQ01004545.1:256-1125(+)